MATAKIELFKGKKLKDGSHPIMLRLTHRSKNKYIYLSASAKPEKWIGEPEQWVSKNYKGFKRLNVRIDNALTKARNAIYELDEKDRYYTVEDLAKKFSRSSTDLSFYTFTETLIKDLITSKKEGNAATYQTTLNVVKDFMKDKELVMAGITNKWLADFESYKLSAGVSINGVSTYLRTIRAILNKAIKENLMSREIYPFGRDGFQIQNSPTGKRAISIDAINAIRQLAFEEHTPYWHAKNYFLFSFYTRGMNWVDMAYLKMKDLADGRINYIRKKTIRKTSTAFSIKIIPPIQEILDYYTANKSKEDFVFPIIIRPESVELTRQDLKNNLKNFNKYLNKIAGLAGIESHLTSYSARHTWGSVAKKKGVNINTISDGYGHSDPSVTRIYLDSIENDEIDKANELIIE